MAKLNTATAVNLRRKMYRAAKKLKADSHGWIHDLNQLMRDEFQLSTGQVSHQLAMMVQEGWLERKGRKSQLYRVRPRDRSKKHQPIARARRASNQSRSSRASQILRRVTSIPGVQKLIDQEIAQLENDLEVLRALKHSPD